MAVRAAFNMAAVALVALLSLSAVSAISFQLPAATRKCLQEDVHKDILVVGNYEVSPSDLTLVTLDVRA